MSFGRLNKLIQLLILLLGGGSLAWAGTATDIRGLYYTGLNSGGGLQSGGSLDANWNVTYAYAGGQAGTFTGDAYVVDASFVSTVAWVQNTSSAQWITAPGALDTTNSTYNSGGSYLPGNGTSGTNYGVYVYTLAFTILGTGTAGSNITNNMAISLTIAADDQAKIYVNPSGNGTSLPGGTPSVTIGAGAWTNTQAAVLANYSYGGNSANNNSTFKLGTNYLVVAVVNSNSVSGTTNATGWNASGFMMYQTGVLAVINGQPVPEVATWMPIAGVVALYGCLGLYRRRRERLVSVAAS